LERANPPVNQTRHCSKRQIDEPNGVGRASPLRATLCSNGPWRAWSDAPYQCFLRLHRVYACLQKITARQRQIGLSVSFFRIFRVDLFAIVTELQPKP